MISYATAAEPKKLEALVVPVFQDKGFDPFVKALDKAHGGILSRVKEMKDFEGKKLQTSLLYTEDKDLPRILFIGMGNAKELSVARLNQVMGRATLYLEAKKLTNVGFAVPAAVVKKFGAKQAGRECVVGIEIADYAYDEHKRKEDRVTHLKSCAFVGLGKQTRAFAAGMDEGQKIGAGVNWTRMLGNVPPSHMSPAYLAKEAEKLGKENKKVKVTVMNKAEITKHKMGCLLGVGRGSKNEPKFVIVEYMNGKKSEKPTVLVGKGITFDSGGLSIKPASYMVDMKYDMLGAATVLGTIKAIAALGMKKNVIGLVPTAENMPGHDAFRPDDILTNMSGKTVEIGNTDAEGRLILSDALAYAKRFEPKEVIDFATLTGACVVALGDGGPAGLFTPVERMAKGLLKSAEASGEWLWRLPLGEMYGEMMKSQVADIANMSQSRYAGASTAAAFLQFFTDYPWAHVDIAGSSFNSKKGKPWMRVGANGYGVQMMVEYLR